MSGIHHSKFTQNYLFIQRRDLIKPDSRTGFQTGVLVALQYQLIGMFIADFGSDEADDHIIAPVITP